METFKIEILGYVPDNAAVRMRDEYEHVFTNIKNAKDYAHRRVARMKDMIMRNVVIRLPTGEVYRQCEKNGGWSKWSAFSEKEGWG